MFPRHGFEPGGLGWFGWAFPLLVIALLIAIGVMLYVSFRRRPASVVDDDPLRRAARRYAAGEIERVEFERIRNDLGAPGDDPLRSAALRLAKGDITADEFDELRGHLPGDGEAD